jgi:hypothetical protein
VINERTAIASNHGLAHMVQRSMCLHLDKLTP